MPVLGITGGIATGKSSFLKALLAAWPAELFDADATVHQLLAADEEVRGAVLQSFGDQAFKPSGEPDREWLRATVFAEPARRTALEAILHPAVRTRWLAEATRRRSGRAWYYVDIPLLYETAAEPHFDQVLVVACAPATQRARLREHRRLDDEMIEKIIGAQLPLQVKMAQADHVIWNDSTVSALDGQAKLFAGWLRDYHV